VAFFSVEFPSKLTINDMKLINGTNGFFAASPSKKYMDKKTNTEKWTPIVYIEQDLLQKISVAAELEYSGKTVKPSSSAPDDDIPF